MHNNQLDNDRNEKTHLEHKLFMDTQKAEDEEAKKRHDLEVSLVGTLKQKKETELEELKQGLEQIDRDFLAMKDYQAALAETAELREKIEQAKVKI